MSLDGYTPDEHFPTPIEKQEKIIISETRNNLNITKIFQSFPDIKDALNSKKRNHATELQQLNELVHIL